MPKRNLVLLAFLLSKFLLEYLLVNTAFELHRDEFLHLDQGKHLAWGFISVPPVTSWLSWGIWQLGGGHFWVRFFPALFGALTIAVAWQIVEEIGGGLFAAVLAATSLLFSSLLRINMLFQPNSLDVFFWTATYFFVVRYIHTKRPTWLYGMALSLAIGFLSKYNIVFLAAGLLPAVLLSKQRTIFLQQHLYIALALALLLITPNLLWQYRHHFPTLAQLKELNETQLVNVIRADFLKDQALFFFNSFFVVAAGFAGFLFYHPFRRFRFLLAAVGFTLALFLILKAKSYYALGVYPLVIAFGAVYLEHLLSSRRRYVLRYVAVALIALLFVPLLLLAFPLFTPEQMALHPRRYKAVGLLRWEDGKDHELQQDFADMIGWKELARKVDSAYRLAAADGRTIVICDNYGQAGAINFYSAIEGMQAVSFNADYRHWMPLQEPIVNVLLVKDVDDADPGRSREKNFFKQVTLVDSLTNRYARERGTRVYLLQGATIDVNAFLRAEILKRDQNR